MSKQFSRPLLSGCRVLVVEDNFLIAQGIEAALEGAGAEVLGPYASMIEALEGMTSLGVIDAAVLDIGLGDQVSYPLAEALQTTGIPFLFLTAMAREALPQRFNRVCHLSKPYSELELLTTLANLCR